MPGGELPLKNDEIINDMQKTQADSINELEAVRQIDNEELTVPSSYEPIEIEDENEINNDSDTELSLFSDSAADSPIESSDTAENTDAQLSTQTDEPEGDALLAEDDNLEDGEISDASTEADDTDDYDELDKDGSDQNSDGETVEDDKTSEDVSDIVPAESSSKKKDEPTEKPRRVDSVFDFIELCVFALAAVFILISFFFRYSVVDGGSMENTLHDNERLIITDFLYSPKSGDIVVVQDKSTALKDPIVKRIIAVGGQTVRITHDRIYVDGEVINEPYVYTDDYKNHFGGEDIYRYSVYPSDALLDIVTDQEIGVYYEITVPKGEIFVMGDHRNNSKDSRDIGTLHEEAIIGKVVLRFFPFDKFGKVK